MSRVSIQMLKLNECLKVQSEIVLHYRLVQKKTNRKVVNAGLEYQVDMGSAQKNQSFKIPENISSSRD